MKSLLSILLLAVLLTFATQCENARAEGLVGNVSIEAEDGEKETPLLKGQTAEIELRPPTWIEGKVFSNDDMLMYSFFVIYPFKKEWRWEIPNRKTSIKLKPQVVSHWKGYKPEGPCMVTCIPMGKGKFKFHHQGRKDGPHGYMERIGETKTGYPKYRFWFDDIDSTPDSKPEAESKSDQESTADPTPPSPP